MRAGDGMHLVAIEAMRVGTPVLTYGRLEFVDDAQHVPLLIPRHGIPCAIAGTMAQAFPNNRPGRERAASTGTKIFGVRSVVDTFEEANRRDGPRPTLVRNRFQARRRRRLDPKGIRCPSTSSVNLQGRLAAVPPQLEVAITGSTGFIGRTASKRLGKRHRLRPCPRSAGFDVLDAKAMREAVADCDAVIHLASAGQATDSDIAGTNIVGTLNVAEAALAEGIPLIYASSAAVYDAESSIYAASKHVAEEIIRMYCMMGLDAAILRIFNVFGEGATRGVVARFLREDPITIDGDGSQVRDFIHVEDVAEAFALCLRPKGCFVSDVGTGVGTTVKDVAAQIGRRVVMGPGAPHGVATSVARNVRIPGWHPTRRLEDWLREAAAKDGIKR